MTTTISVKVLDHGYVKLIDAMGTDLTPLEAARMSTDNPTGVDVVKDDKLRDRLWADKHSSPFEMNVACFELRVPLFVLRQLDRHRTVNISNPSEEPEDYSTFRKFSSRNEFSGRYSQMPDLYYIPEPSRIKKQSTANKQGSGDGMGPDDQDSLRQVIELHTAHARFRYEELVSAGTANEIARMVLPQNQYTKIRIQATMTAWFSLLAERLPVAAQEETRAFAKEIAVFIRTLWPLCWEVFERHTLYAAKLSSVERVLLGMVIDDPAFAEKLLLKGTQMGLSEAAIKALQQKVTPGQVGNLLL